MKYYHQPVLLQESIWQLNLQPGAKVVDGTLGGAGHSQEILKQISSNGLLIGFDLDPQAIAISTQRLKTISENFKLINDNFANLETHLKKLNLFGKMDGILVDLGISSYEIEKGGRGFSFQLPNEPLDMRMNPDNPITAAYILNNFQEKKLKQILKEYGEEPQALQIARRAVTYRKTKKIKTVSDLLKIVDLVYQGRRKPKKIHPATKTFQALRLAVNKELESIEKFLPIAVSALKSGGRLVVISFHSLEDRLVKHFFKKVSKNCICPPEIPICVCDHRAQIKIITKKPIIPTVEEIKNNPRSRSAKLRVIEKI